MGDAADYYTDSDPGDWEDDMSIRRRCEICGDMFVGDAADDPVCTECCYEREDFEN